MSFFDELKESLSKGWGIVLAVLAGVSASLPEFQASGQLVVDFLFQVIEHLRGLFEAVIGSAAVLWVALPSRLRIALVSFRR